MKPSASQHKIEDKKEPMLSGSFYDMLRALSQYILPGVGALYYSLSLIWGLGFGEQVLATTTALGVFVGVVMGISNKSYEESGDRYDGSLVVDSSNPEKDIFSFEVDSPLDQMRDKTELVLKVEKPGLQGR